MVAFFFSENGFWNCTAEQQTPNAQLWRLIIFNSMQSFLEGSSTFSTRLSCTLAQKYSLGITHPGFVLGFSIEITSVETVRLELCPEMDISILIMNKFKINSVHILVWLKYNILLNI